MNLLLIFQPTSPQISPPLTAKLTLKQTCTLIQETRKIQFLQNPTKNPVNFEQTTQKRVQCVQSTARRSRKNKESTFSLPKTLSLTSTPNLLVKFPIKQINFFQVLLPNILIKNEFMLFTDINILRYFYLNLSLWNHSPSLMIVNLLFMKYYRQIFSGIESAMMFN